MSAANSVPADLGADFSVPKCACHGEPKLKNGACRIKDRKNSRRWYEANREKKLEASRRWYAANHDRKLETSRLLYESLSGFEYNRRLLRYRRNSGLARMKARQRAREERYGPLSQQG